MVAHDDRHAARRQPILEALDLTQEVLLHLLGSLQVTGVVLVVTADVGEVGVALAALGVNQVAEQDQPHVVLAQGLGRLVALVGQAGVAQHGPQLLRLHVDVADDDQAHARASENPHRRCVTRLVEAALNSVRSSPVSAVGRPGRR